MSVKENINLDLEGMLKVRKDRINDIRKVMRDINLQDTTRKSLENEIKTIREVEARCNLNFDNRILVELSDIEIKWILGWYRDKKSQSESWCQQLDDLYDKLIDSLNKKNN